MRKFGKPIELRKIVTSDRAIQVLGEHALTLPDGHPARTVVTGLVRRFTEGELVDFDDEREPEASEDELVEIMEEAA